MVRRWARGNAPSVHVPGTSLCHTKSNINMLDLDKAPRRVVRIHLKKSLFHSESTGEEQQRIEIFIVQECSFQYLARLHIQNKARLIYFHVN